MLERWLNKRINELVDKRLETLKERIETAESSVQNAFEKINALSKFIDAVQTTFFFDVEANLDEYAEKLGIKAKLRNRAFRYATEKHIHYSLGKDIYIVKLNNGIQAFKVRPHCAYTLLGIKFLKGQGYGKYNITEGYNIKYITTFTKTKSEQEISVAFALPQSLFFQDEVFSIKREQGKGSITVSLIGYSIKPKIMYEMSALEPYRLT